MIERDPLLISSDAELMNGAFLKVKTQVNEESEARLDDAYAIDVHHSWFRTLMNDGREKERCHSHFSPSRKNNVLSTTVVTQNGTDTCTSYGVKRLTKRWLNG